MFWGWGIFFALPKPSVNQTLLEGAAKIRYVYINPLLGSSTPFSPLHPQEVINKHLLNEFLKDKVCIFIIFVSLVPDPGLGISFSENSS